MEEEILKEKLAKYNQEEILEKIKIFTEEEKENILKDISHIDFEEMEKLYKNSLKEDEEKEDIIEPINAIDKSKLSLEEKERLEKLGLDVIKQGKYAVITMAGGQRNKTWI